MYGILYQHGSLNQDFDTGQKSATRQGIALKCTLRNLVQAKNHVLTNVIANQGDTIGCNTKCQESVHLKFTENHEIIEGMMIHSPRPDPSDSTNRWWYRWWFKPPRPKPPPVVCESPPVSTNTDLCNNYVTMATDYDGRFFINYPLQCVLGQVLLDSDPLDKVDSWKEII